MISIGILIHNSFPGTKRALGSLKIQSFWPEGAEIILVDNVSDFERREEFKSWLGDWSGPKIRWIERDENNLGSARAEVMCSANNSWVGFLDSDCEADPKWLESLWGQVVEKNGQKNFGGVSGIAVFSEGKSIFHRSRNLLQKTSWAHLRSPQTWIPSHTVQVGQLSTSNALFDKQKVLQVGNFSSDFSAVCEDVDLSLRMAKQGFDLYLCSSARVIHHQEGSWKGWVERMWRYGQGQVQVIAATGHGGKRLWPVFFIWPMTVGLFLVAPYVFFGALAGYVFLFSGAVLMSKAKIMDIPGAVFLIGLTQGVYSLAFFVQFLRWSLASILSFCRCQCRAIMTRMKRRVSL